MTNEPEPRRRRRFLARPSLPIDVLKALDEDENGTLDADEKPQPEAKEDR